MTHTTHNASRATQKRQHKKLILTSIRQGMSVKQACRQLNNVVTADQVYVWVLDDPTGFGQQYLNARRAQAERDVDNIREVVEYLMLQLNDGMPPSREYLRAVEIYINTMKWIVSKNNRERFDDKIDVNVLQGSTKTQEPININWFGADGKKASMKKVQLH